MSEEKNPQNIENENSLPNIPIIELTEDEEPAASAGARPQILLNTAPGAAVTQVTVSEMERKNDTAGKIFSTIFDWVELFVISLAIVVVLMTFFIRHSPVVGKSMQPTVEGSGTDSYTGEQLSGDVMLISNFFYTPKTYDIVVINSPHNFEEPIIKRVIATGGQKVEIYFDEWKTVVDGVELDEPYLFESHPIEFEDKVILKNENGTWYAYYDQADNVNDKKLDIFLDENGNRYTYLSNGTKLLFDENNRVYRETNPNVLDRASRAMEDYGLDKDGDGKVTIVVPKGKVFVMGDHRNDSKDSRVLDAIDERYILGKVILRAYPFDRFGTP